MPLFVVTPKGVSIKTWPCVEADGAVWVWHDAEGRAPLWPLEDAPECAHWPYRGRNEFIVSAHIQEIPENGADVAHLNAVHSPSLLSGLGEKYPFLYEIIGRHVWNASWSRNADHTASITLTHDYRILNQDFFHTAVTITQNGPGHVRLLLQTPVGPFLFSQSVTPLAPLLQRVTHRLYSPAYNAFAAWPLIVGEGKCRGSCMDEASKGSGQVAYMKRGLFSAVGDNGLKKKEEIERDILIWNSKRFVSAPTYLKTDKTIRQFRNWYSQFYSEHSLSYRDSIQNPLDW